MYQVVQPARVIRVFCQDALGDARGFHVAAVGLVRGKGNDRLVQCKHVEQRGFDIIGVALGKRLRRFLERQHARLVVLTVRILVVELERGDVVPLALGLRANGFGFLDEFPAALHRRGGRRTDQRIGSCADRNAPVSHGAGRIHLRYFRECIAGLWKPEVVQHGHCPVECLLRLRCTGDRETDVAQLVAIVRACRSDE